MSAQLRGYDMAVGGSDVISAQLRPNDTPPGRLGSMDTGAQLERTILDLLDARADGATICPSDAARAVGEADWRPLMEPARQAAARLVERGVVVVTQGGEVVDPATARGPIRIRRA
jgi:hypothetical protein